MRGRSGDVQSGIGTGAGDSEAQTGAHRSKGRTQADLDTALANLHQAEATITIKNANLEKAKLDLDHCGIYSPINGSVILRSVDVGQTVAAAMNAPVLFTIAKDLTDLQIDSAVAEADVGIATVGQTVDFTVDAFPYQTFHGKVGQVRNAASTVQNVVTYDVVITVKNPDLKLLPGMTANIAIVVAHKDDALKVPNSALRFKMPEREAQAAPAPATPPPAQKPGAPKTKRQQRSVYVMPPEGGKPHLVTVKLGINDGVVHGGDRGIERRRHGRHRRFRPRAAYRPERAESLWRRGPQIGAPHDEARHFIDNVSKIYSSGDVEVHAVREVSLTVQPGEFVAIMGSSGSGKSTMMNMLGCLDRPTLGRYLLDGIDVSSLGRDTRADIRNQKIGFIFQGFNLLSAPPRSRTWSCR